jgi:predicted NAD/FAD-dependent oxidoreductase
MPQIAIIGGGVAGIVAARALRQRQPSLKIAIFEREQRLGGRVATGRRDGYIFEHGAQIMKAPTPEVQRLLTVELSQHNLHQVDLPVWTFDGAGSIAPGDPAQNADPSWSYRDGLDRLIPRLFDGLEARVGQPVERFFPTPSGAGRWALAGPSGQPLGEFDFVLLTPPAPQAAEIVAASEIDAPLRAALLAELGRAGYRRCISLALAYPARVERPFYALVNIDRAHPVAWLALEHAKAPERCPPGHSLLVAQMAPRWSAEHWDEPAEQLERLVAPLVAGLIGPELGAPLWSDVWRWPYALPDGGADFAVLNGGSAGLFFAGDYTAGQGRVHLAIESGWRAAAAIERALGGQGA